MERLPPPYAAVVFDCDSTLSTIEGIEELTRGRADVAELTALAMDGTVPLQEVYGRRLELVRPDQSTVDGIGTRYIETALPHAKLLVEALRSLGKTVAIVSGGLLPPVRTFAAWLGVEDQHVHAVDLRFDAATGAYAGFDADSPLARAGGKLELLREHYPGGDVVLIGDGATDLEAAPACARFVAFAAIEDRAAVVAGADTVVREPDFCALVPELLSPDEIDALRRGDPRFAPLVSERQS